jgi:hypothetical protein
MPQRPIRSRSLLLGLGLLASLAASPGCASFVEHRRVEATGPIDRLAIVPFYPSERFLRQAAARDDSEATSGWEAAALVTRFMTEAIERRLIEVIPENDMQLAFEGQGEVTPRASPEAAALLAAAEFGADAILLGEVHRYRERRGSSYGSERPASVEFEVTLYTAPAATKVWVARFNQTQAPLTSNLFDAIRYPSMGMRFLTVAELSQWGARKVADELPVEGR